MCFSCFECALLELSKDLSLNSQAPTKNLFFVVAIFFVLNRREPYLA